MKTVEFGTQRHTKIIALDEPGIGGACHSYDITTSQPSTEISAVDRFAKVSFQNGPIKETGVNGCHNEDLLAIVLHRLYGFQSGEYRCRENALAITKIEEALHWLKHRTEGREKRGVEGTHKV